MTKEQGRLKKVANGLLKVIQILIGVAKFFAFVLVIVVLFTFLGGLIPDIRPGNVAVIPIDGLISTGSDGFSHATNSERIVEFIAQANENSAIKAILLDINSPGGTPVATDEIARAVKESKKPVVAVIREVGASGAFWIATAAGHVFANRMSVTGSIGVQASHLEFGNFLQEYNVTYRKLTAGKYKDIGTIWREMTPDEQKVYQHVLDSLHEEFIKAVAENRQLNVSYVRGLANGLVYLGGEAKELGLIDELGNKKDALSYIEKELNISAVLVEYQEQQSFWEQVTGLTANGFYEVGQGVGSSLAAKKQLTFT